MLPIIMQSQDFNNGELKMESGKLNKTKILNSQFSILNSIGYSMIELLVVMATMAILGLVFFANYRTLQQAQALQRNLADIQSFVKTTQTNATARVPCPPTSVSDDDAGADWRVKFDSDNRVLRMACQLGVAAEIMPSGSQYTLTLGDNVVVHKINTNCNPSSGFTITFAPLYGNVTFTDGGSGCAASPNFLITLRNNNLSGSTCDTNSCKTLVVDLGGSVYEQ
jgi:type II secretory pathway pseudopilin PulG